MNLTTPKTAKEITNACFVATKVDGNKAWDFIKALSDRQLKAAYRHMDKTDRSLQHAKRLDRPDPWNRRPMDLPYSLMMWYVGDALRGRGVSFQW